MHAKDKNQFGICLNDKRPTNGESGQIRVVVVFKSRRAMISTFIIVLLLGSTFFQTNVALYTHDYDGLN